MLDPAVILLDEPAAGINPTLLRRLGRLIRALKQAGRTSSSSSTTCTSCCSLADPPSCSPAAGSSPPAIRDTISTDPAVLEAYLGDDFVLETSRPEAAMIELPDVRAGYGGGGCPARGLDFACGPAASPASSGRTAPGSRPCCAAISGLLTARYGLDRLGGLPIDALPPLRSSPPASSRYPQQGGLFAT